MKKVIVLGAALMSLSMSVMATPFPDFDNMSKDDVQDFQIDDLYTRSLAVSRDVADLKKHTYGGVAAVAAMNNIPNPFIMGETNVGMAIGGFENKAAFAAGISRLNESGVSLKGSVAVSSAGNTAFGIGVGYSFK